MHAPLVSNWRGTVPLEWPTRGAIRRCLPALAFIAAGCQTPAAHFDARARDWGLVRDIVQGTVYRHVVYTSPRKGAADDDGLLHVYIGGDGSPWAQRRRISLDPTPKQAVTLELMSMDDAESLHHGRPCYHGLSADPGCTPWVWTHGRYSATVVDSLEAALRSYMRSARVRRLRVFGFSGGGALAVLLAARFPESETVVTVAGNLDLEAWTKHHGYSALVGSTDPASLPPLAQSVRQLHLVGGRDTSVPPALVERFLQRQNRSEAILYPNFDHRCCWRDIWPSILARIR